MRRLFNVLSFVFALAFATPAWTQLSTSAVSGIVYDATGVPLIGTTVLFNMPQQTISGNVVGPSIVSAKTDAKGNLSINLPRRAIVQVTVGPGMPVQGVVCNAATCSFAELLTRTNLDPVPATVPAASGGTGIDSSASTGVAVVTAGTWSIDGPQLDASRGGTNADSSGSTGTAHVQAGVWSFDLIQADSYTKAGLLPAGTAGRLARVTDNIQGLWMDTGTDWRSITGKANVMDWGAKCDNAVTDDSAAFQAAIDAVEALGGGIVTVPPERCKVSQLIFDGLRVILEGTVPGYNYQTAGTRSELVCTTGVWCVRFQEGSALSGLRNLTLTSNGQLNAAAPHVITTAGVEYGILIEVCCTTMDDVAVGSYDTGGFQYGVVIASNGNSNVFTRVGINGNTKVGFAVTTGTAAGYAAYHPNITPQAGFVGTTRFSLNDVIIRRNGWGMILRDGNPYANHILIESNYFGGIYEYVGTLDSGVGGVWHNLHIESNWLLYDKDAVYTITQNNLLKETASTWIPWNLNTDTTLNDAGYQISMSAVTPGANQGPINQDFFDTAMVLGSGGVTLGKAIFFKQAQSITFRRASSTGGDQPNAVRFGYAGGFIGRLIHFYDFNGTLPAVLGSNGARFEPSALAAGGDAAGGLTAQDGTGAVGPAFRGLAGNVVFPSIQVPSSDANTLDDYEESTWTPVLTFDTPGNLNVVYATQVGSYTKIGRMVTVQFHIETSTFTHTTASGNVLITGLPFTSGNVTNRFFYGPLIWQGITKATYTDINARNDNNESQLHIEASGSGVARSMVAAADMPSAGTVILRGTLTYFE